MQIVMFVQTEASVHAPSFVQIVALYRVDRNLACIGRKKKYRI